LRHIGLAEETRLSRRRSGFILLIVPQHLAQLYRPNTIQILDIDFQSADDAKLRGLSDPDVLALAAKEGRILVSHDCNTMPDHFAGFVASQHSPGVFILARDIPISLRSRSF